MAMQTMSANSLTDEMKLAATKTALLVCVSGQTNEVISGHNKFYNLFVINGELWTEWGRVDKTKTVQKGPASSFDSIYRSKVNRSGRKAYTDVTELRQELIGHQPATSGGNQFAPIQNSKIAAFVQRLMSASNMSVKQNYKIAATAVTQAMIDAAQGHIDWLTHNLATAPVNSLNDRLIQLFTVLPREMASVENNLFLPKDQSFNQQRLYDEQSVLDSMRGAVIQVNAKQPQTNQAQGTILDSIGVIMDEITPAEYDAIAKKAKDALTRASWTSDIFNIDSIFKVKNKTTESTMKNYVLTRPNKKTEILWHGSRDENWLAIMKSGLLIRPAGVRTTGSMYGHAIYFSNVARKSLGYSSIKGSYWSSGSKNTGILALYEVHTGKRFVDKQGWSSHTWDKLQSKGNYDSVYAPPGGGTINDEVMVYRPDQSTIRYVVVFSV